ncbi:hypothetical protein SLS58_009418 [Diplodia intermedia]|uniref:T6SS Phospholipase effector Tle1-like catalytic domain-containing protein n=1 Tax=Diplodia intermedia TaxID=856260 RepID=A0ABR3TCW9_9PEZI
MGFKDTLNFDDAAYEQKLRSMDTADLQNREVEKIRQYVAGSIGVGCVLGAFPSTMGTSLLLLPLILRTVNIARRKLNLIRATLFDRHVPPYQLTKKDFIIPLAIRATSLGLGTAVGLFVDITTVTPLEEVVPAPADGFDAVAEVLNTKNPDAMLNGFASGIAEQGNQPVINETVSHAAAAASQCGAGHAFDVQDGVQQSGPHHTPDAVPDERTDPAFLAGMSQGARLASAGESKAVSALLSQIPLMLLSPRIAEESEQDEAAQLHIGCDRCKETFDAHKTIRWLKKANDPFKHDLSFNNSIKHVRHAVALNEDRRQYLPELFDTDQMTFSDGRSLIQAWFIGAHADIGGGASDDGLSLYPLQWMFLESKACGLVLEHEPGKRVAQNLIDNPLTLTFPDETTVEENSESPSWDFKYRNGMDVSMYDLRISHNHGNLQKWPRKKLAKRSVARTSTHMVRINPGMKKTLAYSGERRAFANGNVKGYRQQDPNGTIIHPSVYFIMETYPRLGIQEALKDMQEHLQKFRASCLISTGSDPWIRTREFEMKMPSCRILICGNAGAGKSTLLNRVFGIPMSEENEGTRGKHNIDEGFESDQHPGIIIHDSEGFQSGNKKEVAAFEASVKKRCPTAEPPDERFHAVWICIEADTPRPVQTAMENVISIISKHASTLPVFIVATKKDRFLALEDGIESRDIKALELSQDVDPSIQAKVAAALQDRQEFFKDAFRKKCQGFKEDRTAFAFVSKNDHQSVQALVRSTMDEIADDSVHMRLVAANFLLEENSEVDLRDCDGRTPLSWAAERGNLRIVEILLERGASPQIRDEQGRTPLSYTENSSVGESVKRDIQYLLREPWNHKRHNEDADMSLPAFTPHYDQERQIDSDSKLSDTTSIWSAGSSISSRSSIGLPHEGHGDATKQLANELSQQADMADLYAIAIRKFGHEKFAECHDRLLKKLFQELRPQATDETEKYAVRIFRQKQKRSEVTEVIQDRFVQPMQARELLDSKKPEANAYPMWRQLNVHLHGRYLNDDHWRDGTGFRRETEDDFDDAEDNISDEDDGEEEDEVVDVSQEPTHVKAVQTDIEKALAFLVNGQPFSHFRENLDRLVNPSQTIDQAVKRRDSRGLRRLLKNQFSLVTEGDYIWLRELNAVSYSRDAMAQLLLEAAADAPWIVFEPQELVDTKPTAPFHHSGCPHHQIDESSSRLTHIRARSPELDLSKTIQELCGLGGILPTSQGRDEWTGQVLFQGDENSAAFLTYDMPSTGAEGNQRNLLYASKIKAIEVGGGLVYAVDIDSSTFHWEFRSDKEDLQSLPSFHRNAEMTIGALVTENSACTMDESQWNQCRKDCSDCLVSLGTYRTYWEAGERQIGIQGGHSNLMASVNQTSIKHEGRPIKNMQLNVQEQTYLLQFLECSWGLQVSYCTGISRRVPLRALIADLLPVFVKDDRKQATLKFWINTNKILSALNGTDDLQDLMENLRNKDEAMHQSLIRCMIEILDLLSLTGIERGRKNLIIAWPHEKDLTSGVKIACDEESYWARILADSHQCATYAYITNKCLESEGAPCRGTARRWSGTTAIMETAVSCYTPRQELAARSLMHGQYYHIETLGSLILLKARKDDERVRLTVSRSAIPRSFQKILLLKPFLNENAHIREKQRPDHRAEQVLVSAGDLLTELGIGSRVSLTQ